MNKQYEKLGNQIILTTGTGICSTKRELLSSETFSRIFDEYCLWLSSRDSPILDALPFDPDTAAGRRCMLNVLKSLGEVPLESVTKILSLHEDLLRPEVRIALHAMVEGLYDFWRRFDRFLVLLGEPGQSSYDQRPYRSFNASTEALTHLVRSTYRDICENITGDHPRVYRQVSAGCNVALIATPKETILPGVYNELLGSIPFIRQVWIDPPFIIDPPMNTRTGQFARVDRNPLEGLALDPSDWLCFPAKVGPLTIFAYCHKRFISLGSALANLFDLATDDEIAAGPSAVYLFGAPVEALKTYGDLPTVFFDDEKNGLLAAAVPLEDRFGYFGYLKKMILTLHNVSMMKMGRMPYHGAMVNIALRNKNQAAVLIIGDTAAGKSETLEAFRILGEERIRRLNIVADDMGSLAVDSKGSVHAYGTEIGAFIRLDDLQQGYALGQIDRAIIMSPQKVNARVVLPVTTIEEVLKGYPLDYLLYANNYEEVDEHHPALERLNSIEEALAVFRKGVAMAKGTTSSSGLVSSYFANIFGPPQYREIHEKLAARTFEAAFSSGVWVGQIRTRLAVPGYEFKGPEEAARALLALIDNQV